MGKFWFKLVSISTQGAFLKIKKTEIYPGRSHVYYGEILV
jgi:hypothetical protein